MLYLTDDVITPGAAVRSIMFTDASELTFSAPAEGAEPIVELTTNRGAVLCAAGTVAYNADLSDVRLLGPEGWTPLQSSESSEEA